MITDVMEQTSQLPLKRLRNPNHISPHSFLVNEAKTKQLVDLENAINLLERENSSFKIRIDGLQKQTQVQEAQLGSLNSAIDFIRLEDIIRFVSAKCPSREEMFDCLKKRQIDPAILRRTELTCLKYDQQTCRWHFLSEYDVYRIAT